jgi:hypothetical protein
MMSIPTVIPAKIPASIPAVLPANTSDIPVTCAYPGTPGDTVSVVQRGLSVAFTFEAGGNYDCGIVVSDAYEVEVEIAAQEYVASALQQCAEANGFTATIGGYVVTFHDVLSVTCSGTTFTLA